MTPCRTPLPLATCVEYWLGELPPAVEDEVEAHLLACTECSGRIEPLAQLAHALPDLVRRGVLPLGLTPTLLQRLEQEGLRIRYHHVSPGGSVCCTAGPDDDLVAMRLTGEFRLGERVDLAIEGGLEGLAARREDVLVDHAHGEVVFVEPGALIRRFPAHVAVIRLYGVGEAGERPIGEYTLHHTPWPGT
jgi:hypothetical protein